MEQPTKGPEYLRWIESTGLLHMFRTLKLACQPAKIGVAFLTLVATFTFGFALDVVWRSSGLGVAPDAVAQFIHARETDLRYEEAKGDVGVFAAWRDHQRRSILGLLGSSLPGSGIAMGTPVGNYIESTSTARPLRYFTFIVYGAWWMLRFHPVYTLLFCAGGLVIWSLGGGMLCRMAAVQFARDEKPTTIEAYHFTIRRLWGGFALAPCVPMGIALLIVVPMVLGGLLLRVPYLGDVIGGPLFVFAIIGGFLVTVLLAGFCFGGGLLWPSVAVEGSDAFDAFQRSVSYVLNWKIWKAVFYVVIATVFASLWWVLLRLGAFIALRITHAAVSFGTMPFGWFARDTDPQVLSKLEVIWQLSGPNALHAVSDWSKLTVAEYFSAACIWFWIAIIVGLMWAFLVSFYFSVWTVIYFLLRRDVDMIEFEDIHIDNPEELGPLNPPATV